MNSEGTTVLHVGEALSSAALTSPDGAFALEHRAAGELALRDRVRAGDIWRINASRHRSGGPAAPIGGASAGSGVGSSGLPRRYGTHVRDISWQNALPDKSERLTLTVDGYLLLEDERGRPLWRSGEVDRRVNAAVVTNDGRLLLVDQDGWQRWSRDPITDADLANHRPASGDRMSRGQRLDASLTSPSGRYLLSHARNANTVLVRSRGGIVWSRRAGTPGAGLFLGHDGRLRTGTDSSVLAAWTGRRVDPAAYVVSALVVTDFGEVVLLGDDGTDLYRSATAAEEAWQEQLDQEFALIKQEEGAKPLRPHGSGLSADWFDLFDIDHHYCITLVRGISPTEALLRLGVCPARITPTTYLGLIMVPDGDRATPRRVFVAQIDDWVMLLELDTMDGADRVASMSKDTQAIVCAENYDGEEFLAWAADGTPWAQYAWDLSNEPLRRGGPADEGIHPDAIVPFMRMIGLGCYERTDRHYQDTDDNFLPPLVEIACLIANIRPRPEHFTGEHSGAVYPW